VTDGTLVIGLYKTEYIDRDWCCVDNFTRTYLGPTTGVQTTENGERRTEHSQVYDLQGRKLNAPLPTIHSKLPKGVYIVNGKKISIK
jgi:hypothetical protein